MAWALAAGVTAAVITGCQSSTDPAPGSSTTSSAPATVMAWPDQHLRPAPAVPGDTVITREQLIGMTMTEARALLESGTWKPQIREGTIVGYAPGEPVPDKSNIGAWRIAMACFSPDYTAYLTAEAPEQFREQLMPQMYDNQYRSPTPQCDGGWSSINLSKKP
ncbi:hypothetical protein IU501_01170 [Nocardia otitidiscaviarum]|uniref:hypothetical protein n=1 Tax=Nocardia otitidiscaviarum TaxID=1823 RepID=UPI000B3052A4|nr:hypothetical protein [Nocardia otitidiscaviarum]MBF6131615.1 hypothetical protein [Nocardia otitidiscaviarum]MBF6482747.1 hypothetical protein [Nocardia otitidiscaviarum]